MIDRYNAFISYAWCDNEPFSEGGKGWISTFVDRLGKHLKRELPREIENVPIWLDYEQMRGNDNVNDEIRAKVEASRLLVPIVSSDYLESPWCTQEREIFISRYGADSGRIFPVWMEPVEDLPPELAALLKYKFWYEDDRKQPRTRWFPDIDPTDREYGFLQQNLSRDMAACLKKVAAEEMDAEPQAAPVEPAHVNPPPELSDENHIVLVNGGEGDADLILKVADCLWRNHGLGAMVPVSALPDQGDLKSSDLARDLRDKLTLCTAVLIVFRNGPAHQIHRHITEYLKATPQRPKGAPPATLDLCHPAEKPAVIGFQLPQMRIHSCDADCADDCARRFAERLGS